MTVYVLFQVFREEFQVYSGKNLENHDEYMRRTQARSRTLFHFKGNFIFVP